MAPKFVQAKKTFVSAPITDTETTSITLNKLVDLYNNALAFSDFGDTGWITIGPGTDREEIVSFTGLTVNADSTVTLSGITRGLVGVSPYGSGGTAYDHASGTVVVVSNNPQLYDSIIEYIDGIALAGAPDASTTTKGLAEEATQAEIDADTASGSTGRLFANPSALATSKYGTRLPSSAQKDFLNGTTGIISPYAGLSAPTGFLLCDGSSVSNDTYSDLLGVVLGRYGYGTGTTFTADDTTDFITVTDHGLENGDILLLDSSNTLPAGLSVQTVYYVVNKTTNTFQVSTTSGGSNVDITDTGTGTHSFYTEFKIPQLESSVPLGYGQRVETFTFEDSDVTTGTDVIVVDSNDFLQTGTAVALTTSGTLPAGLSATTYYVIRQSATSIKLASSVANANTGTAVDITGASGGGTHTLTLTLTSRSLGDTGGEETHALTDDEMPSHQHDIYLGDDSGGVIRPQAIADDGTIDQTIDDAIEVQGADAKHNNMPPYTVVNYIIKT